MWVLGKHDDGYGGVVVVGGGGGGGGGGGVEGAQLRRRGAYEARRGRTAARMI